MHSSRWCVIEYWPFFFYEPLVLKKIKIITCLLERWFSDGPLCMQQKHVAHAYKGSTLFVKVEIIKMFCYIFIFSFTSVNYCFCDINTNWTSNPKQNLTHFGWIWYPLSCTCQFVRLWYRKFETDNLIYLLVISNKKHKVAIISKVLMRIKRHSIFAVLVVHSARHVDSAWVA